MQLTSVELALVEVGQRLRASNYQFVTPTPTTHARVNARPGATLAADLRDVFGWSRLTRPELLEPALLAALTAADALEMHGPLLRSRIRFSTLDHGLYAHSAHPTLDRDAVFFGPDTYRFAALLAREVMHADRVVDVGAGTGAGALSIASRVGRIVLADINPRALSLARVNAELAGLRSRVETTHANILDGIAGPIDLVIANPPYLVDADARVYCHGGDDLGTSVAVRIVRQALERLTSGGHLVLYTGAPICAGVDRFRTAVAPLLADRGAHWTYSELDPDVFGEELEHSPYAEVERIAAVGLSAVLP